MAKISYQRGIKCKKCGKIIIAIDRFSSCVFCQNCKAYLANFDYKNKEMVVTNNAEIVTVEVTHKLFRNVLKEV